MQSKQQELQPNLHQAFNFAQTQVKQLIAAHPDTFPMYTREGNWAFRGETWTNWCEGFLGGLMWIFHTRTRAVRSTSS